VLTRVDVCARPSTDGLHSVPETEEAACVDEGPWLVHALHVDLEPTWEPLNPVHTWFDMPPFSAR
jgi:hypothetical protein